MSNSWFQFKQFRIEQGKTAMKVGTDGVLLGAWVDVNNAQNILDIGTGTGLIALMLAQRNSKAQIIGVELEEEASRQAEVNFRNSSWNDRLNVVNEGIQQFSKTYHQKFDVIVSNPPFFINSFASEDKKRQTARHTDSLSFEDLLDAVKLLLTNTGDFSVILPSEQGGSFIGKANRRGLYMYKQLDIYPTDSSQIAKRVLLSFTKEEKEQVFESLVIEPQQRHQYSEAYMALTKDFYLKF